MGGILIITGTVIGGVGIVATSANNLAEEIRSGNTPFGRSIASAVSEGEAEVCEIITNDQTTEIPRREMRGLLGMAPGANQYGTGPFGGISSADEPGGIDQDAILGTVPFRPVRTGISFPGRLTVDASTGDVFVTGKGFVGLRVANPEKLPLGYEKKRFFFLTGDLHGDRSDADTITIREAAPIKVRTVDELLATEELTGAATFIENDSDGRSYRFVTPDFALRLFVDDATPGEIVMGEPQVVFARRIEGSSGDWLKAVAIGPVV